MEDELYFNNALKHEESQRRKMELYYEEETQWARAYRHSYDCCVYNTHYADNCLKIDQDCIDDFNWSFGTFILILGIVIVLFISGFIITLLCMYYKGKKKREGGEIEADDASKKKENMTHSGRRLYA